MSQLKREKRRQLGLDAWVVMGGFARRPCRVLDLSSDGARIEVTDPLFAAETFGLTFVNDVRKATPCRVIWRKRSEFGIEFV